MNRYRQPLATRLRESARRKERYRCDTGYRLHKINLARERLGLPLLSSLDGVSRAQGWRTRDDAGRFEPGRRA